MANELAIKREVLKADKVIGLEAETHPPFPFEDALNNAWREKSGILEHDYPLDSEAARSLSRLQERFNIHACLWGVDESLRLMQDAIKEHIKRYGV